MDEAAIRDALSLMSTGKVHHTSEDRQMSDFSSSRYLGSLERYRKKHRHWLYARGIQAYGLGEKLTEGRYDSRISLRFYVDKKRPLSDLEHRIPKSVRMPGFDRIETDVIEVGRVTLQASAMKQRIRPVFPGCSVGRIDGASGSVGCIVKDEQGKFYIMSSAHVLSDFGIVDGGDLIVQPSATDDSNIDDNVIAKLSTYFQIDFNPSLYSNRYDIAIAEIDPRSVSPIIGLLGVKPTQINPQLTRGMAIKKVGSGSGLTSGYILDVDCVYPTVVPLFDRKRKRAGFCDQVACTPYALPGDSGAAVLDVNNNLIGIHMAGSSQISVFNKVDEVFSTLKLSLA